MNEKALDLSLACPLTRPDPCLACFKVLSEPC